MNKKKILITGARGFIGKNLVEYLAAEHSNKYELFFPYHKDLELTNTDAVDNYFDKNKIDIIIHAANIGGSRKTSYDSSSDNVMNLNIRMFLNLSKQIKNISKFIFLGSGAEYDRAHYLPKMLEAYAGVNIPANDYGLSKLLCSKLCENSVKMVDLRVFGMYGKYEDLEYKFISNAIVKNLLKLPIVINQNVKFDYMYINDGVKLIEKFIGLDAKHRAYNLTTGRTMELVQIVNMINDISDFKSDVIIKNKGMNTEYSGENSRLLKEVKFSFSDPKNAIKELFAYYKSILPTIDKKKIETDEYIAHCKTSACANGDE